MKSLKSVATPPAVTVATALRDGWASLYSASNLAKSGKLTQAEARRQALALLRGNFSPIS